MRHGHGHANILGFYNLVDWTVKINETNELTETGRCLRPQEYRGVLFNDMPHHPNSIFFFLFLRDRVTAIGFAGGRSSPAGVFVTGDR